jgi:hypothetical protein
VDVVREDLVERALLVGLVGVVVVVGLGGVVAAEVGEGGVGFEGGVRVVEGVCVEGGVRGVDVDGAGVALAEGGV